MSSSKTTIRASGWLFTWLAVVAMMGGAVWWRLSRDPDEVVYLPRTRALILQKTGSLEAYNNHIPEEELMRNYEQHLGGRPVRPEAFTAMTKLVIDKLLPTLWHESQNRSPRQRATGFIPVRL